MIKMYLPNFILILFIGFMFIYTMHEEPSVIVRYPNINMIKNVTYFEEDEENSTCDQKL
jgi:hypothetical protein